jgi:hypothetical protein
MRNLSFILSLFVCLAQNLIAQDNPSATDSLAENKKNNLFESSGFVRGFAQGGSKQFDFSSIFGELALKTSLGDKQKYLKADLRIREGLFFGEQKTITELKEAYAGIEGRYAGLFLGTQIVKWGSTDGFNPTDNLNPNDYFLLTPDPSDQKLGNFMLRCKIRPFPSSELELVAIPFFKPSVYRYDLFTLGEGVSFAEEKLPATTFANAAYAARLKIELPAIGFSISYFNGYDPFYGFRLKSFNLTSVPEIVFIPDFFRKQSLGFDFEIPAGEVIMRGEFAYDATKDYKDNMYIPNPNLSYVAGIELGLAGITAIAQYIGKYTFNFEPLSEPVLTNPVDPLAIYEYAYNTTIYNARQYNRKIMHQQEKTNSVFLLSLQRSFAYNVIDLYISGYYDLTSKEYMIRPEMKWQVDDAVTLSAGENIMDGPDKSIFEHAGKVLGGLFFGLTVNF